MNNLLPLIFITLIATGLGYILVSALEFVSYL